ncbi:MAG: hypothetical protein HY694_04460, partial [Deltaproteobacteria bacterium]|nr:hypothetical protein [Deltaproteobacteria bacterium]
YDGEGTGAQRTHLTECEACATRYWQLGSELEAISQVLREEPPPKAVSHRLRPFTVRWLPTAAALALALVLIWVGVRIWTPSTPPPVKGTTNEEIWSLLEGFSADLFLLNEAIAEELWIENPDSYDLAAALESDRPCEWYDMLPRSEGNPLMEDLETLGRPPLPSCVEHYHGKRERLPNPKV